METRHGKGLSCRRQTPLTAAERSPSGGGAGGGAGEAALCRRTSLPMTSSTKAAPRGSWREGACKDEGLHKYLQNVSVFLMRVETDGPPRVHTGRGWRDPRCPRNPSLGAGTRRRPTCSTLTECRLHRASCRCGRVTRNLINGRYEELLVAIGPQTPVGNCPARFQKL